MAFFSWAAPAFHHLADRWSDTDIGHIAAWLAPYAPHGGSVLDVGGGTGALATRLAVATGAAVTVLDPTPEMLSYVPEQEGVTGIIGSAEDIPFDADTFDAVLVSDAFHHFEHQDRAIVEMVRVVRPGGGIVMLEFDPSSFGGWALRLVEKLFGEPGLFLTPHELTRMLADHRVTGHCEHTGRIGYRFVGTTALSENAAAPSPATPPRQRS